MVQAQQKPLAEFEGPLFVVGLPRSGTKLLRSLLNQNHRIGIVSEVNTIPALLDRFGTPPPFQGDPGSMDRFRQELERTPFFAKHEGRGQVISRSQLEAALSHATWTEIFAEILRFYAPDERDPGLRLGREVAPLSPLVARTQGGVSERPVHPHHP